MLSKVLKKEDCAGCRFCCAFRRQSLWEFPRLTEEFAKTHTTDINGNEITYIYTDSDDGKWAVCDLTGKYKTDDPEEEAPCPFLDPSSGCVLSKEDKPFECSAWPLRYMRMNDGSLKVCLTPTCPSVSKVDLDIMKKETKKTWHNAFSDYATDHPYIIKDYRDGFIELE